MNDLEALYKSLSVLVRLFKLRVPDVFDGRSLEDLPSEILLMFLTSPTKLGWNPKKGPLDRFLFGVLKHKALDHLRRQVRTSAGSLDDPDFLHERQLPRATHCGLDDERAEIVKHDSQFSELLAAAGQVDDGPNINQKLAEELGTTTKDIVNRKKRLARKYLGKL